MIRFFGLDLISLFASSTVAVTIFSSPRIGKKAPRRLRLTLLFQHFLYSIQVIGACYLSDNPRACKSPRAVRYTT